LFIFIFVDGSTTPLTRRASNRSQLHIGILNYHILLLVLYKNVCYCRG
jgi:hypothetical protein